MAAGVILRRGPSVVGSVVDGYSKDISCGSDGVDVLRVGVIGSELDNEGCTDGVGVVGGGGVGGFQIDSTGDLDEFGGEGLWLSGLGVGPSIAFRDGGVCEVVVGEGGIGGNEAVGPKGVHGR